MEVNICDSSKETWRRYYRVYWKMTSPSQTASKEPVTRWKSMICDSSKETWRRYYRVYWKMTSPPQTPSKEPMTRWKSTAGDSSKPTLRWHYRVYWKMLSKPQTPSTKSLRQVASQQQVIHPSKRKMVLQSLLKDVIYTTNTIYKWPMTRLKSIAGNSSKQMWNWYYRIHLNLPSIPQTPSTKSLRQGGSPC